MFDGITILIYPFVLIPILSIILAYLIDYIYQRRKQQHQIKYLTMLILSLNQQQEQIPPAYETLFF